MKKEETKEELVTDEVTMDISKVALEEGEETRIVISISNKNELSVGIKSLEDKPSKVHEIVGLIEMAKAEVLTALSGNDKVAAPQEMAEIVLDQHDFDLDSTGGLTKRGHKVGDTLTVPKEIAEFRKMSRDMKNENKMEVVK